MGFIDTAKREITFTSGLRGTMKWLSAVDPDGDFLVGDDFERAVDAHRSSVAIRFENKLIGYGELDAIANSFAHWALDQGLKQGDCVALFMENRPEYIACWLGLAKVGVVTALVNTNLQGKGLAHCIAIADAKALIVGHELAASLQSADEMDPSSSVKAVPRWSFGGRMNAARALEPVLKAMPKGRPSRDVRKGMKASALCLYVYTSGTTGLPKAAKLTHARTTGMMRSFISPCKITPRDRIYLTLPLYHGTGGICGVGQALLSGASLILRQRFSATQFWEEAVTEGATAFVYIGELCRYLLNTPPHPAERKHQIRTGFGNGLRADVWQAFEDRFGIEHLVEFYGSTEGNVSFVNFDGKVGAVGRIPKYLEKKFNTKIVRFDIPAETPIRNDAGFCIEAAPDEVGEALGQITDEARQRFRRL